MTSSNIKDVSVSNISQSNSYNSLKTKEDTRENFLSLMSDSVKNQMVVNSVSGTKATNLNNVSKGLGKSDFNSGAAENNAVDTGKKPDKSEVKDLIKEYTEAVKKEVKEKLDISEEELTLALEELGLTLVDLNNPNNLALLFSKLEGSGDTVELLVDSNFKILLDNITELTREFAAGLDMSLEEAEKVLAEGAIEGEVLDILSKEMKTDDTLVKNFQENIDVNNEALVKNHEELSDDIEEVKTDIAKVLSSKLQESNSQNSKNNPQSGEDPGAYAKTETNLLDRSVPIDNKGFAQALDGVKPVPSIPAYSGINPADIINQIVTQVRTNITAQVRSMELQLNPENLGKMIMQVSESEGQITAKFFTANESVKAALVGAIASLIEKLNEQGVKVDAVSVSVSAHEFEENLEKNFMGNQGEDSPNNRENSFSDGINLGDESYMEDRILSEEEALTVSMMKTYGNTVNFKA